MAKAFTDINQSKKLAEILPPESADMIWVCGRLHTDGPKYQVLRVKEEVSEPENYIPAWSLAGTVIKTEDIVEDGTFQDTHGYFVDSDWYNAECTANGNTEIWWDKFAVQELINKFAVEYQRRITEMLDVIKD